MNVQKSKPTELCKGLEAYSSVHKTFAVRHAVKDNVPYLCALYRECFPDDVNYISYFGYLRKWLIHLVTAQYSEVYIMEVDNKNVGSATLVLEHEVHYGKKEIHKPPLFVKLLSVVDKPALLLSIVNRMINRARFSTGNIDSNLITDRSISTWVDPIAISAAYRNRGYARYLLSYLEKRSMVLSYRGISLWVDKNNEDAIRLYENCNYHRSSMTSEGYIYKKVLCP
jgi:ribosomal protein S18 acetylase RimI-like enzyme